MDSFAMTLASLNHQFNTALENCKSSSEATVDLTRHFSEIYRNVIMGFRYQLRNSDPLPNLTTQSTQNPTTTTNSTPFPNLEIPQNPRNANNTNNDDEVVDPIVLEAIREATEQAAEEMHQINKETEYYADEDDDTEEDDDDEEDPNDLSKKELKRIARELDQQQKQPQNQQDPETMKQNDESTKQLAGAIRKMQALDAQDGHSDFH